MAGIGHQLSVFVQRSLSVLRRLGLELLPSLLERLLVNDEVKHTLLSVDDDGVAVSNKPNGTTLLRLGHDVTDQETVRAARETTVGDQGNVLAEPSTHDGGRGFQHLNHSGGALGTLIADDDNGLLTLLDLAALEGLDEGVFAVEGACLTLEAKTFLSSDLADGAAGGKGAAEDLDVARGLDGVGQGTDNLLVGREALDFLDVLGEGLTGHGHDVSVDQVVLEKVLQESGGSADALDVGHDVLTRGLEVGKEGRAVRNLLEVIDGELNADAASDGDEVKNGVGGASGDVDDDHSVLEC